MSQATQGSTGTTRSGRVNKTDQKRRSWSVREEEVLIVALKELVALGWKSDNGFRAGYLSKLEEAMKKEFPTTDLKGMPHINSKVTTWKKTYSSLWNILKTSGVGFNVNGKHMIDCDDEQWENFVRADDSVRNFRYKSWPYVEDWKLVFGKDRATGDEAEDVMEAAFTMYRKLDINQSLDDGEYHVSLEDILETGETGDNVSQTQAREETVTAEKEAPTSSKKRRRSVGFDDRFFEALTTIGRGTETRLDTISSRMGYDYDVSKARKEVFAQLSGIPGLSKTEKFDICNMLAKEVELLDVFSSLPEDSKEDYVLHLLALKHK
ncbi:uncharacterized protein LOC131003052 [Salvia miltiorrhiza]|uniref:uncharacterized protein LOC130992733 n=1 Tax=Salvia miltiorrhiza TaxID=226208 RepID=UPI0025AB933B|nr:uncharacterized protein LOC130992733 [Salvia miltiorrhiza]XP_057785499.1 uncharacterized protein LOC131003052 [Salvia miltiorrhiza]